MAFCVATFCATTQAQTIEFNQEPFLRGLEQAFETPRNFAGHSAQEFKGVEGPNCDFRSRLKLNWNGDVQKVKVYLDDKGNTAVSMVLTQSRMQVEGYGRDGLLCRWAQAQGSIGLGQLSLDFKLLPTSSDHTPDLSFDHLSFSEIRFTEFKVGMPGLGWVGGDAPVWLEDWVETNLNVVIQNFLSSELKVRLNQYLSQLLGKKIGDYIHPHGEAALLAPALNEVTFD